MTDDEIAKRFICLDCSADTSSWGLNEYYMVHDHVWTAVAGKEDGMLCIGCLETRPGRTLIAADFTEAPINHGFFTQSERLRSRLGVDQEIAA